MNLVQKLSRITLICSAPDRLADFYEHLGFVRTGETSIAELAFAQLMGIAGATARSITLQLGEQEMELSGVHPLGRPYPRPAWASSLQHFAIVVSDMGHAFARLSARGGWTTISAGGPQLLPASSGGVVQHTNSTMRRASARADRVSKRRHARKVGEGFAAECSVSIIPQFQYLLRSEVSHFTNGWD